mmetsp:Transcript_51751/g.136835  ORF Transcript_51751/g.136835 Transcript_51751/m.136835 type:complete len:207 (+) Transcript_51751:760-1380(+)
MPSAIERAPRKHNQYRTTPPKCTLSSETSDNRPPSLVLVKTRPSPLNVPASSHGYQRGPKPGGSWVTPQSALRSLTAVRRSSDGGAGGFQPVACTPGGHPEAPNGEHVQELDKDKFAPCGLTCGARCPDCPPAKLTLFSGTGRFTGTVFTSDRESSHQTYGTKPACKGASGSPRPPNTGAAAGIPAGTKVLRGFTLVAEVKQEGTI